MLQTNLKWKSVFHSALFDDIFAQCRESVFSLLSLFIKEEESSILNALCPTSMVLYILNHILGSSEIFSYNLFLRKASTLFKLLSDVNMLWLVGCFNALENKSALRECIVINWQSEHSSFAFPFCHSLRWLCTIIPINFSEFMRNKSWSWSHSEVAFIAYINLGTMSMYYKRLTWKSIDWQLLSLPLSLSLGCWERFNDVLHTSDLFLCACRCVYTVQ